MKNLRAVSLSRVLFLAALMVALVISFSARPAFAEEERAKYFKVTYLDVWQGDCEIIRTPSGKVIMIDAGDTSDHDDNSITESYILPYLNANGIKKIDMFIISHAHADHIGGMLALIDKVQIGAVYENKPSVSLLYDNIMKKLKQKGIPVYKLWRGDKLDFGDGIEATVLHPPKAWSTGSMAASTNSVPTIRSQEKSAPVLESNPFLIDVKKPKENDGATTTGTGAEENLNNFSVVLNVKYKEMSYLFSGDAEKEAENEIIAGNPAALLQAFIYKAAHHGSSTSSLPEFLAKIKAPVSIISCGDKNQFKHPSPTTVQNIEFYSKTVYRTDKDKTIEHWTDGVTPHFSSSNTPNALVTGPEVTNITPYSATIEWQTTHMSASKVKYSAGSAVAQTKQSADLAMYHKITLSGLKPGTAYSFNFESPIKDDQNPPVSGSGTFQTVEASGTAASITLATNPKNPIIFEPVSIFATVAGAPEKSKVTLYEDSIAQSNVIGTPAPVKTSKATFGWTPKLSKAYEIFATLTDPSGKIIAVSSIALTSTRRRVVIDLAHDNYQKNNIENFKMSLYNHGFEVVTLTERLTASALEGAAVLVISEPSTSEAGINQAELAVIKKFVNSGSSLLMIGRCDFGGNNNPQTINKVLEQVGSNIRLNADEVLDPVNSPTGGQVPYLIFAHLFSPKIIAADVKKVIFRSTASMLNAKMKPITAADKTIIPICYGDENTFNIDSDKKGDGVIYPKGTPVVMDAAEITPSGGKIAVWGCFHIYSYSPDPQTETYNYNVVYWLSKSSKKRFEDLSEEMTDISESANQAQPKDGENEDSAVISTSIRADEVSKRLLDEFDYAPEKIEASTDHFISYFGEIDSQKLAGFSGVIKEVLDKLRYEAAQNPELLAKLKDRITALEDLNNRALKVKK